jgi:hypothetical protein
MIWILLFLSGEPALADSPHLPPEMQQKVDDMGVALRQSYEEAQKKLTNAEKRSDLVHSVTSGIAKLWVGVKAKGIHALVYLDHQLHEHVIGPERN